MVLDLQKTIPLALAFLELRNSSIPIDELFQMFPLLKMYRYADKLKVMEKIGLVEIGVVEDETYITITEKGRKVLSLRKELEGLLTYKK